MPFLSQQEASDAFDAWGANCGPGALAACLGWSFAKVQPLCEAVGFAEKRYMSPSMMLKAIEAAGLQIAREIVPLPGTPQWVRPLRWGLARVQWTGPWTKPGVPVRAAYGQTHWIHIRRIALQVEPIIFDINGGYMAPKRWESEIVPLLTTALPNSRRDGGWYFTHLWEVFDVRFTQT